MYDPTNYLDVETLGSLENALLDFPGCAVITSHDRWFLDRVATHILAWEGDANWFWFEGNFESYEKNKVERLGPEAARPHAVTHRKLTRACRPPRATSGSPAERPGVRPTGPGPRRVCGARTPVRPSSLLCWEGVA